MEISVRNLHNVGLQVVFLLLVVFLSNFQSTFAVSVEKDLSMTKEEKAALDKFKVQVMPLLYVDYMKTDIYLIRWLRARDYDLNLAETMLRGNINWRKEHNIDTILSEDWSDMRRDFHATIDTYDKQGRPIGVIDIYDWDIRACALAGRGPRLLRYMDYLMENITQQVIERQGKGMMVTRWKVLGGADGFNMIEHGCPACVALIIQFLQSLESHYPGWLDEMIIIDAPSTLYIVLDTIRPFLSRHTRDALKVFGPNKNKWMAYMDQRIARDQRRPQYGGSKPPLRD